MQKTVPVASLDVISRSAGSFRDPSGFVFQDGGVLYRQVNVAYRHHYLRLVDSGLYSNLTSRGWLIQHKEVDVPTEQTDKAWRFLRPEPLRVIAHPFEWCFSQLKDAALLTLDIQRLALDHGMTLKDASAYNVQFHQGRPILIDTLSFETYVEGEPWVAYRQFCQHFLAPLALMAKKDVRLSQLLRIHLDGIPLDLASSLLPRGTWFKVGLAMHLHLHARAQKAFGGREKASAGTPTRRTRVSKTGLIGLIEGLRRTITKLDWHTGGTEWANYYQATNYSDAAFQEKKRVVETYLKTAAPGEVWDMGANTGVFSRIAAEMNIPTVAFDIDPAAVELNYRTVKERKEKQLLPLLLDLTNPSPALGWNNAERDSLLARGPVDCVMALALIHHLAISNNVPLRYIASFFAGLCRSLIIEFVPKSDSQVQWLLRSRKDIFEQYDRIHFEQAFAAHFAIQQAQAIEGSERVLYLMTTRAN